MPAPSRLLRPYVFVALCALGAGAVTAADHAHEARPAASVPEPSAKPAKAEPPAVRDPMDMLREKLAQKLGAGKPVAGENPNVVRVVAKASTPAASEHVHEAAALHPARRKAPIEAPHAAGHSAHWDYAGSGGPETWGQMKPEFAKCSTGTRQSPIDIRDGIKVSLDPVQFDYKPSAFRVIDNGHTVQVNVAAGNSIEVMGRRYELVQFHFHRPSEERIDGRQFDMVAHLVHKDIDGRLAVVAVLLDRGSAQPIVQSVWNNLPLEKGEELAARSTINLNDLLPPERNYFTYMGSLTTPPCSEGVLWMVMKQPVQVSGEQIGIFARLYPMNARPIQSVAGRLIKESN
ncbi:MAG: carbonic anhydrase family protein [Burkholderiales bacterium]